MSVQQLVADLANLATESKRRSHDVKTACDTAIAMFSQYDSVLLKSPVASVNLSLAQRKDLAKPFIASLLHSNVKFATISIPVLHRLINFRLIPDELLLDLLASLGEASNLAIDIQLRTLQCLPSVMQSYKEQMHGELLLKLLSICAGLTATNKPTVVINTASATLQQLFSFVYDAYSGSLEQKLNQNGASAKEQQKMVTIDEGKSIELDANSYEGFRIFEDLCRLASGEKPTYLSASMFIDGLAILELIENVVASHKNLFVAHQELGFLLRQKVIPKLLRSLNEAAVERNGLYVSSSSSFPIVVRVMRIILVLLSLELLEVVVVESEVILSYLNLILSDLIGGSGSSEADDYWEYLVLEVYRNLFHDFDVIKSIFVKFDQRKGSKNILQELLSTLSVLLLKPGRSQKSDYLHPIEPNSGAVGSPPSSSNNASSPYLSSAHTAIISRQSNMKIAILDHLDKQAPPTSNIPSTYSSYLILQILTITSEGIAKFVSNLSKNSTTLENDVEFVSALIEASYPDLSQIFESALYTVMDNESFHGLIRSIQKFTHTTGLLGLGNLRDGLLIIISESIIKNVDISSETTVPPPSEHDTSIFAIGESIVDSLGMQEKSNSNTGEKKGSFNSRHLTCFRALVNLAVSLGSTLDISWNIIWVTFQWCDYFVHGTIDLKKAGKNTHGVEEKNSKANSTVATNFESLKKKLYDSFVGYQDESFYIVLQSLTYLSTTADVSKVENSGLLKICPFNRSTYFMNQVVEITSIDVVKFLVQNENNWQLVADYFIKSITVRSMHYNLRIHNVQRYNSIIQNITREGFQVDDDKINTSTANKSLSGFINLLDGIFELGKPQELLVTNCEIEIHLLVLTTLHQLIDTYDKYFKNSWDIVFSILNTSFKATGTENEDNEKLKLLLATSFDTLKLILDEFIFSLPFDQIKILIDTLYKYCKQNVDINILFSAVSYFWLIGDSIKKQVTGSNQTKESTLIETVKSEGDLITLIESSSNYTLLDIYLLLTLSKITHDSRAQVRDGAIQTFFQIVDNHGNLFDAQSWDVIFKLVLSKFLTLELLNLQDPSFDKKEWIKSLQLILSGLVSIYSSFLVANESSVVFWNGLISYFNGLLGIKWIDLNVLIFESFNDCLTPFQNIKEHEEISDSLFKFWTDVAVEYDFLSPKSQESFTKHMQCFPRLYDIVQDKLTLEECQTILNTFNSCACYPVLQETYLDNKKPSKLQQAVYENYKIFQKQNSDSINSLVIQLLSNIIVFPFATRSRIEKKIEGTSFTGKTPTFIAISSESLKLLGKKLTQLQNLKVLIEDKGILKLMRSMLELVHMKFKGVYTGDESPIWIQTNEILKNLIIKVFDNCESGDISIELWKCILSATKLTFLTDEPEYEKTNIEQYFSLIDVVLSKLTNSPVANDELIQDFVEEIYNSSFLFSDNELEKSLRDSSSNIFEFSEKLCHFDFNKLFGTTEPLVISKNKKTAQMCLKELVKFSTIGDSKSTNLNIKGLNYFVCRLAFSIRRFISDQSLLYKAPLPQVQQDELLCILEGILVIYNGLPAGEERGKLKNLYPLLISTIPYSSRIKRLSGLIDKVLTSLSV